MLIYLVFRFLILLVEETIMLLVVLLETKMNLEIIAEQLFYPSCYSNTIPLVIIKYYAAVV